MLNGLNGPFGPAEGCQSQPKVDTLSSFNHMFVSIPGTPLSYFTSHHLEPVIYISYLTLQILQNRIWHHPTLQILQSEIWYSYIYDMGSCQGCYSCTRPAETENAKTLQIADFDAQKLSGHQIRKLPIVSANLSECPQTFKSVHKFSEFLETFQSVRKICRVSRNFPECMETFQRARKL